MILSFEDEISDLRLKLERSSNKIEFEKRNLNFEKNRLVSESYSLKNGRTEESINRRLRGKYEDEHIRATKALKEVERLKEKNHHLRNNLNELEDKFYK